MRIVISGIPIDIQKKNIKNMHLQIKPPDGHYRAVCAKYGARLRSAFGRKTVSG